MARTLDADYIDKLNRTWAGGVFIKTVRITIDPDIPTYEYWADVEDSFSFNGNTYDPVRMAWGKVKLTNTMSLPSATVTISNIGGVAEDYIEELDITENEILLQLLHKDLLATLTNFWSMKYKIKGIRANRQVASVTVTKDIGVRDKLPKQVALVKNLPGIVKSGIRIF